MEEQVKEQKIEEVKKKVSEILNLEEMEFLLKSNEIVFDLDGITYRIRKPSFQQKQEAYKKRVEKFTELLRNDKYILEEDLKSIYLKRGINIDDMNKKVISLCLKRDGLMLKLGEAITQKSSDPELKTYKKEIESLNLEISDIITKKTQLLEFSLENQVLVYVYSYLTFLISEKKVEEEFIKVWNNWEEFQSERENIVNKLSYYTTIISNIEEI